VQRFTEALWRILNRWILAQGLNRAAAPGNIQVPESAYSRLFQGPGRKFLHVGCGTARKNSVTPGLQADEWSEIRLDIDPAAVPDIVSSMLDMSSVPAECVDAVYSSHNIEHLYPHEVPVALAEFFRVLKPDGLLVLGCPDLQSLCRLVVEDKLTDTAYASPAGPIAPLDVLYGHRPQLAAGNLYMAHHTGFTLRTLVDAIRAAGFHSVAGRSRPEHFDLWVVAAKSPLPEQEMQKLAEIHWPR